MSTNPQAPTSPINFLQEDKISQETKELMPTLPQHKAWLFSAFYQYQGFWHVPISLDGALTLQKHFQAHESDVFLVTTPKSGTTWLKAIGFALVNREKYNPSTKGLNLDHPLLNTNPHELVPLVENEYNHVVELISLPSPRLIATHLPVGTLPASVEGTNCKIVYMCRDPKDVLISLWHYINKMRAENPLPLEEAVDMFCNGYSQCGPFWDHVLGYWKASLEKPDKVLFIKYEEMKKDPLGLTKRIAEFIGYGFSAEEEEAGVVDEVLKLCSFDSLSNLEVNKGGKLPNGQDNNIYFRKGKVGGWANELTPEMALRVDQITEQKFSGTGLKFWLDI